MPFLPLPRTEMQTGNRRRIWVARSRRRLTDEFNSHSCGGGADYGVGEAANHVASLVSARSLKRHQTSSLSPPSLIPPSSTRPSSRALSPFYGGSLLPGRRRVRLGRGGGDGHPAGEVLRGVQSLAAGEPCLPGEEVRRGSGQAISFYSKALPLKPQDPVILGNRSAAFCRTSQLLKDRSARDSEYQPLNGLDPTTHAELALKDAEKVIHVQWTSPKAYFLKANALVLLEQYEEARETILSGLQIDPLSNLLQTYLQEIDRVVAGSVKRVKHWKPERTDDLECTLCFKLLYEPVTTPCGHSFCRSCLHQSMDHGNKCPMCRRVLFISPRTYPISVTLNNIIQKSFPEEYAERKSEQESLTHLGVDIIPLFVMDVVLPCQKMSLNIFEPRYRLMVRRIMEGNRRMGMVAIDPATGSIADFACEVEILECEPLPDGRFYLEVEGQRRFRILQSWDQDGYRVAEVEWIWDTLPPKDSQEKEDLMQMAIEAAELTKAWFKRPRESMRIGRRSRQLELFEAEGVPKLDDPERFSFWLINLLNIRPSERLELLRLQDTSKRISRGLISLQAEEQGCRVQ